MFQPKSLESEWESFEKMIAGTSAAPDVKEEQYLVGGIVAYPFAAVRQKRLSDSTEDAEGSKSLCSAPETTPTVTTSSYAGIYIYIDVRFHFFF